jgi:hypothetical protein
MPPEPQATDIRVPWVLVALSADRSEALPRAAGPETCSSNDSTQLVGGVAHVQSRHYWRFHLLHWRGRTARSPRGTAQARRTELARAVERVARELGLNDA